MILHEKVATIIFLQDFDQSLQLIFFLQDLSTIFYFLQEKFHFSARFARYVQECKTL